MQPKTFAIPLQKRKDTSAPNGSTDYKAIKIEYDKRFGGPFFPIRKEEKP